MILITQKDIRTVKYNVVNNIRDQVWDQVYNKINIRSESQIWNQDWSPVNGQIYDNIREKY